MKKVLLTVLALAFAVSFTFAQMNKSDVTQTGSNTTDVTQTNNAVAADQDNEATVDVSGSGSTMEIIQTNNNTDPSKNSDNVATITSMGNNNVGFIEQRNQPGGNNTVAGTIDQIGDEHSATIEQVGFNSAEATVNQTVGSAKATVVQRSTNGKDVVATVDQEGNNYANVSQTDNNLLVDIDQINTGGANGLENRATVTQGTQPSPGVVGAKAFVTQNGQDNTVTLDQANISAPFSHRADLDQFGNGNSIGLQQDGSSPGDGAVANISQTGDDNTFRGLGGNAQAFQGSSSRVDAFTDGNNNLIEMNQGVNSEATLTQDGDWNVITMDQASNSTVTVDQDAMGGTPTNSNTATISSSDGSVNITQTNN